LAFAGPVAGDIESDVKPEDSTSHAAFPIVGIGASAGGREAFERFLAALPAKLGFACIYVQHLSPEHKSLLPELIRSRKPGIDVNEISDGMEVHCGKLYINPPGKELRIQKGTFHITPRRRAHLCLPIDDFFESLAEEAGERAIAVVLSGAGTDGARGIRSIRTVGGTVLVQDPETAEFPGMPSTAINTGQVDRVFSPEGIAKEIVKMQAGRTASGAGDLVSQSEFDILYRLVHEKTGNRFNHYKRSVVARRIKRRMYLLGVPSVQAYAKLISGSNSEAALLSSDLMIGVTSFFRDRLAWKALKLDVIRKIVAENEDSPVRVWTPACATGEETYSIAMMLHQEMKLAGKKRELQIFATDVNERALEKAREGTYPVSISADVPADYMKKFFTHGEDGLSVTISKEIREAVVFAKQDLLTDPPFSRLDLIICRNFLIYLEPDAQEKCIDLFHYALKDGGYLFLGNAESVGGKSSLFKSLSHKKCRIYRKLGTKSSSRLSLTVPFAAERTPSPPIKQASEECRLSVAGFVQETLLTEYAPAAVAINHNYDILYHNGPTSRYLRQPRGAPTQNLLDLLPENLKNRIRGAIYRVTQETKPVSISTSFSGNDDRKRQVTLRISKLRENLFVIVFRQKDDRKGGVTAQAAASLETAVVDETAVRQLENELSVTRAELQSNIEQLKSLNEELQSSNEELQAANEELETSREELQSLNEELITVNSQLQSKIEEEEATNNDLNNFLSSTNIPTLFLDHEFKVRRFTPAMSKLLKFIPADIGRPVIDMSQENLGPDLIADARTVLDNLTPVKREIRINSAWHIRSTLPYRTFDNRIEGVIITYNNVTEIKHAEERSRHLASFPQLNPNPVVEVDLSGKVIFSNPATLKTIESLGMGKDNVNAFLPSDLDDIIKSWDGKKETTHYREVFIRERVFSETVHLTPRFNVARIYAFEITKRKRAEEAIIRAKEEWERTFDSVPDLIAILDTQHRVMRVNQSMAARLGLRPEECIGLPCYKAVHGRTEPPAFCPHSRTLADRRQHVEEVHEDSLGGDFIVSTTPLYDEDERMIGSVHVAHDITERKKAEAELQKAHDELEVRVQERTAELVKVNKELETEVAERKHAEEAARTERQRLYDVLETLPVYVVLLTPDYHVPFANRFFRERFGESHGKCCFEYLFNRTEPCEICETYKVLRTNAPLHWEWTGPDSRNYDIYDYPFVDADGSTLILEMGIDITEQKRAEKALKELNETLEQRVAERTAELTASETRYRTTLDSLIVGCQIIDSQWRYVYMNDVAVDHARRAREELLGNTMMDIYPGIDKTELFSTLRECMESRLPKRTENFFIYPDGSHAWFDLSIEPAREGILILTQDITKRKRAEEALRESEERFRTLFEDDLTGDFIATPDGRILLCNNAFARMYGFVDPEEAVGSSLVDLKVQAENWTALIDRLKQERIVERFESYHLRRDGAIIHVVENVVGSFDGGGELMQIRGYVFEDTERKRFEQEILRLNKAFKALSDSSQAIIRAKDEPEYLNDVCRIVVEDCDYSMVWIGFAENDEVKSVRPVAHAGFDDNYLETLQVTWADTELGRGPTGTAIRTGEVSVCRNMLHDPAFAPWREQAIQRGYASSIVFPIKTGDTVFGAITIYSREADPFSEAEVRLLSELADNLAYGIEVLRGTAARRKAEEALQASEVRLARSQEIAHLGSWELDLMNNELTWSDEVYRIFGMEPQEFEATYEAFLERVHPDDRSAVDAAYSDSVRDGRVSYEIEHRIVRRDTGEIRWVHERCRHVTGATGKIVRSVGMVHDITERKKAEEELRKLTEELKRSNSDLQQFAYIASHDLQSPLRNVEGFVKMLTRRYKGQLDEKADEFIHYISTGVKDMQMLILDILEYSKVGSDGGSFSEIDASLCVAKAISNLNDAIAEKNAVVEIDEPFPKVFGDSVQLTSLFQNLIGNAIKFCTDIPKVHLSFRKEGREFIFSVRDNGIGMSPDDTDKIFAVFHRLHSKSEYPGTGIGLAICKRIVERHKGRIWVESEPGKGSTFYFTLPIMD
jgi:two-component system CheB/CheR fusion protein